jgi:mRNA interferase MazF
MEVRRGEIYWADLSIYAEKYENTSLQKGLHPFIVMSNEKNNIHSPNVNGYSITSKINKAKIPVHVEIGYESGLPKDSIVLVEQPMSLDKRTMLKEKAGEAPGYIIDDIEFAALIQGQFSERSLIKYLKKLRNQNNFQPAMSM